MSNPVEQSPKKIARAAGALYLIIIFCGIFSEAGVRMRLIVAKDAGTTAANIFAHEGLFRIGFAADVVMLFADVAIAIFLYVLFRSVSETFSLTAAAFRLTQAAILGYNLLNYYAAILLLSGGSLTAVWRTDQLNALAMFFLELHGHGYDLGLLFFGMSNFVLGYLVIRAVGVPTVIGYALMGAAMVYLLGSLTRFLFPAYLSFVQPLYVVPLVAELAFALWLLLKGGQGQMS